MSDYRFIAGDVPAGYTPGFEASLFNEREHRHLQKAEGWCSFHALDDPKRKVAASIHFHVEDGIARSHPRSPFGSFDAAPDFSAEGLSEFFVFIESGLREMEVRRVLVKNPSPPYYDSFAAVDAIFINAGYAVSKAEVSSVLDVGAPMPLHSLERNKLKKAQEAELIFHHNASDALEPIYNFVLQCRRSKGYTLSMTMDQLRSSIERFPERYALFSAVKSGRVAAAAITVHVRSDVLYDFAHDHASAYDSLSPVVFLMEGIRMFCVSRRIRLLDMGTSGVEGTINFGLLKFKTRLGARAFPKFTFEKILN